MLWQINWFPDCTKHVFLSHSREDHDSLVRPVFDRLVSAGATPWIDRHHYPYGRDSRLALQGAILECRHVVFFVTQAMLASGRGWCTFELAYTEILQHNLTTPGGPLAHVFLPLFFVPQSDGLLPRTVWQATRDRGKFFDPTRAVDPVGRSTDEILRFLRQEQRFAEQLQKQAKRDSTFRGSLPYKNGFRRRVTAFDPQPLPETLPAE